MSLGHHAEPNALIDDEIIRRVLDYGLRHGADFVEVFAEDQRASSATLDDRLVKGMHSGRDRGAGVRAIVGERTGYAHTTDLSLKGLLGAAEAASVSATASNDDDASINVGTLARAPLHSPIETFPETVAKARKVELLTRADDAARAAGGEIAQVSVSYADNHRIIQIANTRGVSVVERQVRTGFGVSCVAKRGDDLQHAFSSLRQTMGFELFDRYEVESVAAEAARVALLKLDATPAPSGPMPVVMKHGAGGVLFHEACGHGLEADAIAKEASVFAHRLGELVASPLVTLVDNGTRPGEWGTFGVDDEGSLAQSNTLIKDGLLTDYMWDYLRSTNKGRKQSGNGRRESYQHMPMVRMSNTYVANGASTHDDIVSQTPQGLYVAGLGGGNVNPATGDFVFSITEAYLIEGGRVTAPVRDAVLIGNGPGVLGAIDAVADDFSFGWGGSCGKNGQSVPVGQGQPTLRVATGLSVGGTAA